MPTGKTGLVWPSTPCPTGCGRPRVNGTYCRECQRELSRASALRDARVRLIMEARSVPCVDCGLQLPWEVMELDHVRGDKSFNLNQATVRRRPLDVVAAEVAKCECRCPNCHRMRHYRAVH